MSINGTLFQPWRFDSFNSQVMICVWLSADYICTGVAGAVSRTQRPLCSPSCCQSSQTSIWPFSCELMAHGNSNSWTAVHGTLWKQQHRKNVLIKMCLHRKKLERSEFHWETILSVSLCFAEQRVFESVLVWERVWLFSEDTIFFHCRWRSRNSCHA